MTTELKNLYERKKEALDKMGALAAELKKRSNPTATSEEMANFNKWDADASSLNEQIEFQKKLEKANDIREAREGINLSRGESDDIEERNFYILKKKEVDKERPISDFVLRNFDVAPEIQKANVYQVLKALHPMAKNNKLSSSNKHALDEMRSASGTALLTEFLSAQLLDGGLSKSRLAQAGMQTFAMQEGTHRFAKVTSYPTFTWEAENAPTTDKDTVFSSVDFDAKTLRGFVTVSGELAQDGHNLDMALRQVFNKSIGNSVDTAGLFGAAASAVEPEGIYNYTNVNRHDAGAVLDSWDYILNGAKLILDDNGEMPDTAIMSPGLWLAMNKIKDPTITSQASLPPPWGLAGMKFYETSKIPNDLESTEYNSAIFLGGFNNLNLGVRLSTQVVISPVISDKFQYNYFVAFRGDIKPNREEDFAVITALEVETT